MNVKTLFGFGFFLLAFAFTGCRKELPSVQTGDPIFSANGRIGTDTLNLRAGINNYYMYSSHTSDAMGVYEFKGELKMQNCNSICPNSLSIRIRDYANHNQQSVLIDSSFLPGPHNFVTANTGYTVDFFSIASGDSLLTYNWSFGDNSGSTLENPSHTYTSGGQYLVMLIVNGGQTFTTDTMIDTLVLGGSPCMTSIFGSTSQLGDSISFYPTVTGGVSPFTYSWDFGDGNFGSGSLPTHHYANPGRYNVRFAASDANGCPSTTRRRVKTYSITGAVSNFYATVQNQPAPDYRKVIVEWTDGSGNVFTSANALQPGTSSFEILSVENYETNENGEPCKKIRIRVNCVLYNGSNSVQLQNTEIIFAFSHE